MEDMEEIVDMERETTVHGNPKLTGMEVSGMEVTDMEVETTVHGKPKVTGMEVTDMEGEATVHGNPIIHQTKVVMVDMVEINGDFE